MKKQFITTRLGQIAVYQNNIQSDKTPLILLHGVYFDHHLWDMQVNAIHDRRVFTIDMPWHGESKQNVPDQWTLQDCADMLVEILDTLQIPRVIAVGHSWGSMTILRAAARHGERFESVGFCNMPFEAASARQKITFGFQHAALLFRNFYTRQTAKALFGKISLGKHAELPEQLKRPMDNLTPRQIRKTDRFVILEADEASRLIETLKVPARALKGREDYVPAPPGLLTTLVTGGHVSPLENPEAVYEFIERTIDLVRYEAIK